MTKQTPPKSPGANPAVAIPQLRAALDGRVISPGDPRYDEARTAFPGGIDRRPAAIGRVADASDVSRAASLARESVIAPTLGVERVATKQLFEPVELFGRVEDLGLSVDLWDGRFE